MRGSRLVEVGSEDVGQPQEAAQPDRRATHQAAMTALLLTTLKTISQKTILALASLVDAGLIASAFALWIMVIAEPTVLQLVAVGMYGAFVMAALALRRRA